MTDSKEREELIAELREIQRFTKAKARGPMANDWDAMSQVTGEAADMLAAQQEELTDWELSFNLYEKAVRRGTKMWHDAGGDRKIMPDTGKLVAWLLENKPLAAPAQADRIADLEEMAKACPMCCNHPTLLQGDV